MFDYVSENSLVSTTPTGEGSTSITWGWGKCLFIGILLFFIDVVPELDRGLMSEDYEISWNVELNLLPHCWDHSCWSILQDIFPWFLYPLGWGWTLSDKILDNFLCRATNVGYSKAWVFDVVHGYEISFLFYYAYW